MPEDPMAMLKGGRLLPDVALLWGCNTNDSNLFVQEDYDYPVGAAEYIAYVEDHYGGSGKGGGNSTGDDEMQEHAATAGETGGSFAAKVPISQSTSVYTARPSLSIPSLCLYSPHL